MVGQYREPILNLFVISSKTIFLYLSKKIKNKCMLDGMSVLIYFLMSAGKIIQHTRLWFDI